MDAYTLGWYGWTLWFAVEEALALKAGHGTLTANLLRWFGVRTASGVPIHAPTGWQRARRALLLLGLAFLDVHLVSGGTWI